MFVFILPVIMVLLYAVAMIDVNDDAEEE